MLFAAWRTKNADTKAHKGSGQCVVMALHLACCKLIAINCESAAVKELLKLCAAYVIAFSGNLNE